MRSLVCRVALCLPCDSHSVVTMLGYATLVTALATAVSAGMFACQSEIDRSTKLIPRYHSLGWSLQ